jgi:hypothetical protein
MTPRTGQHIAGAHTTRDRDAATDPEQLFAAAAR